MCQKVRFSLLEFQHVLRSTRNVIQGHVTLEFGKFLHNVAQIFIGYDFVQRQSQRFFIQFSEIDPVTFHKLMHF